MTPKARDLQEPAQHDMIEALRDALRQDNSEELNPRMRDALKGFRKDLHAHPYVRSLEKHRASTRSLGRRRFVSARLALAAGAVVAVAAIGIVLTMTPRVDVLAQAIAALADVETAHMILTFESDVHPYDVGDSHMWYSRRHGYRSEDLGGFLRRHTISVYTSEGTWVYSPEDRKVVIKEPDTETLQAPDQHRLFFGGPFFKLLREQRIPYQQSDGTLDGVPMTRFDFEMPGNEKKTANTVWIDKTTGLLAAIVDTDVETGQINGGLRCEYNMPLDPALFTFEIPEGATVEDRRGAAKPQEGSQ